MSIKYIGNPNHDDYDGGKPLRQERAAVRKGAALLDQILPGWHKKVNLDELQMHSGSQCMLGQLFGHDVEAKLAKTMYPEEMKRAEVYAGSYGYNKAVVYDQSTGQTLLERLMDKLGLANKPKAKEQLEALRHVCNGHSNECLWSEAVAERLAKEGSKDGKSSR